MKAVLKRLGLGVLTAGPIYAVLRRRALAGDPVSLLCYHTLRPDDEPLDAWLALRMGDFRAQIAALRAQYDIISLDDAMKPATGRRPRAVLTFDDGEWGMYAHLLPFIEAEKLPVTIYVATGQIETGQPYWFDRVMNALQGEGQRDIILPDLGRWVVGPARGKARWQQISPILNALKTCPQAMRDALADQIVAQAGPQGDGFTALAPMTLAQLKTVAANPLVTIGAHSHGHELLDQLPLEAASASIARSKTLLEEWTGNPVRHFAYPNGNYSKALMGVLADQGFLSSVILEDGLMHPTSPRQALPRVSVGRYDALDRVRLRLVGL